MVSLTETEKRALLILLKDYTNFFNANSLSKELGISHVGSQKLLKRLKEQGITHTKKIGKSIVHKPDLENDYNQKLASFLLADEANNYKRWKEEFKELDDNNRIVMVYGSIIKNYKQANDVDIMVVMDKKDINQVDRILRDIDETMPKKIHAIKLSEHDLIKNINEKNGVIIDIIRNAVVLYGQDRYVEVLRDVAGF